LERTVIEQLLKGKEGGLRVVLEGHKNTTWGGEKKRDTGLHEIEGKQQTTTGGRENISGKSILCPEKPKTGKLRKRIGSACTCQKRREEEGHSGGRARRWESCQGMMPASGWVKLRSEAVKKRGGQKKILPRKNQNQHIEC